MNDLLRRGRLLRCHTLLVNHLLSLQGPFGRRKVLRETIADPAASKAFLIEALIIIITIRKIIIAINNNNNNNDTMINK